jgi:hypothetical protein
MSGMCPVDVNTIVDENPKEVVQYPKPAAENRRIHGENRA